MPGSVKSLLGMTRPKPRTSPRDKTSLRQEVDHILRNDYLDMWVTRPREAGSDDGGFMTIGCAARAAAGLPVVLWLTMGVAYAQGASTTITKTPAPQPAPAATMRPSIDESVIPAESATPVEEVVPPKIDEGGSWQVAVEQAKGPTPLVGKQQAAAVGKINAYFNGMTSLEGNFEQTDANNNRTSGRFYVLRPGKIRFDYAPPSPLRIVADGYSLGIQDKSLKTVEKYPIKSTPFRLLLANKVDLGRDAKIVGVEQDVGKLAITLEDRKGTSGHIRLLFKSGSQLELQEWTITDAQGLTTRVTVDSLVRGRKKSPTFFTIKEETNPFRMGG